VISNVEVTEGQTTATITWQTNEPATSVVNYGLTAAYGDTEQDLTLVTDHSITLTGLSMETTYHYQIQSEDAQTNVSSTDDATFTTLPSFEIVSDDFNVCVIDTGVWTLTDPLNDATMSITGAGSGDAHLNLSVPAGVEHDMYYTTEAPRLMQPASDEDFEIEAKFDSNVTQAFQLQGILIEAEADHFLRFDFYSNGASTYVFAAVLDSGTYSTRSNLDLGAGFDAPMYMRVNRTGDVWTQSYSSNGVDWTEAVSFAHVMVVSKVGLLVGNLESGGITPAHTALVDYFFDTANPIVPEDGASVPSETILTLLYSGSGTVSAVPDQTTYTCGDSVTLTANPAVGYVFDNWSGDLTGSDNPAVVIMDKDRTITANFVLDPDAPVISNVQVAEGETTATITWQTDKLATSVVNYGLTSAYGNTEEDLTPVTNHSVTLTGLTPATVYHYEIQSDDGQGHVGFTADATFTTETPVNQPPVAVGTADPTSGLRPLLVNFGASGSYDPDGTIELYEWDFDGDGTYDWNNPSTGTTSYTYTVAGSYDATLRVTDDDGANDTMTVPIDVSLGDIIYVPDDYTTIQAAIDAAVTGDTIRVDNSTYTENITLLENKTLSLEGGWDPTFSTQDSETTINGILTLSKGVIDIMNFAIGG
jgi:uncharacterized repeat protein (TIGR02543 family)